MTASRGHIIGATLVAAGLLVQLTFPLHAPKFEIWEPMLIMPASYVVSMIGCGLLKKSWVVLFAHVPVFFWMLLYHFAF